MKKIGSQFLMCLREIRLEHIIKAYALSIIFIVFTFYFSSLDATIIYFVLCAVLYPFSYLLIRGILEVLPFGGIFFLTFTEHIVLWIIASVIKFILYYLAYGLALFIAPIGILFIVLRRLFYKASDKWEGAE